MNTKREFRHTLMIAVWLVSSLWVSPALALPSILYVKPGLAAHPEKTCASWAEACDLQIALAKAAVLAPPVEIWAAEGTYPPGALRVSTFQLLNGVALYGGFAGNETARGQRNPGTHVSLLSGEIGATGADDNTYHVVTGSGTNASAVLDGFTISGGNATGDGSTLQAGSGMINVSGSPTLANLIFTANSRGGMHNENSNPDLTNVVFTANTGSGMHNLGSNPTLEGVTFSANDGGMYNVFSSPTLTDVTFSANTGSGMYNTVRSNPIMKNVTFTANHGGGMYNEEESNPTLTNGAFTDNDGVGIDNYRAGPTLTNVIFSGNTGVGININHGGATLTGVTFTGNAGGIDLHDGVLQLTNVTFSNNTGTALATTNQSSSTLTNVAFINNTGGGMINGGSTATLTNVIFIGNTSSYGGGMYNHLSYATLTNVTFFGNSATIQGGGLYINTSLTPSISEEPPILTNCIFWGNTAAGAASQIAGNAANVTYSDIQGGYAGTGNIGADPLFVDAAHGNLRLRAGSPAIEAGSSAAVPPSVTTDLDGQPRFVDFDRDGMAQVDLGAYEAPVSYLLYLPSLTR